MSRTQALSAGAPPLNTSSAGGAAETSTIKPLTALDRALGDPLTDAKFQALKALNARKVKQLMAQIDLNQSEITDMKVQGKDNVRTRIIQGLKNKIAYEDTVLDYLKSHLELPVSEVEDVVMRKTIGGPKRFRPVVRTELEKKIAEAEKRIKLKVSIKNSSVSGVSKDNDSENMDSSNMGSSEIDVRAQKVALVRVAEDVTAAKRIVEIQSRKLNAVTASLRDLKARQNQVVNDVGQSAAVRAAPSEGDVRLIQDAQDQLSAKIKKALVELATVQEETLQFKADAAMATEQLQLELDRLEELHEKSLRQNTIILKRMAELETELDKAINGGDGGAKASPRSFRTIKDMDSLAGRCQRTRDALRISEARCKELEERVALADSLKEQIRLKNEEVRELKRSMHEVARLPAMSAAAKDAISDNNNQLSP